MIVNRAAVKKYIGKEYRLSSLALKELNQRLENLLNVAKNRATKNGRITIRDYDI